MQAAGFMAAVKCKAVRCACPSVLVAVHPACCVRCSFVSVILLFPTANLFCNIRVVVGTFSRREITALVGGPGNTAVTLSYLFGPTDALLAVCSFLCLFHRAGAVTSLSFPTFFTYALLTLSLIHI